MSRIDLLRRWKAEVDAYTLRLTEAVPDSMADFRPVPEQMTTLELIRHLAEDEYEFQGDLIRNLDLADNRPKLIAAKSVTKSRRVLKEILQSTDIVLRTRSEHDLDKPVSFPGSDATVTVEHIVKTMIEHQIHHRGQLLTYLRIQGLAVPLRWQD